MSPHGRPGRRLARVAGPEPGRDQRSAVLATEMSPAAASWLPAALTLDLLAAVLASGAPPYSAVLALAQALETAGQNSAELDRLAVDIAAGLPSEATHPGPNESARGGAEPGSAAFATIRSALSLAARSGLPPADLLRAAAARDRVRRAIRVRATIRRLEVLMVVPAGLCLLPAFVLLGVAPVVIALFHG